MGGVIGFVVNREIGRLRNIYQLVKYEQILLNVQHRFIFRFQLLKPNPNIL
jgi:hypothetical protein